VSVREPSARTDSPGIDGAAKVLGERGVSLAHRARSLESRVSSLMALGVMGLLGVGLLTWYYGTAFSRSTRAARAAEAARIARTPAEAPLPQLGRIALPAVALPHSPDPPERSLRSVLPQTPALVPTSGALASASSAGIAQPAQTQTALALQRRLSGPPFARQALAQASSAGDNPSSSTTQSADSAAAVNMPALAGAPGSVESRARSAHTGDIGELLKPDVTTAVSARAVPTERYLLPKGAFIDCTLETAIDSSLPGMTTCITATDTFSVDGTVVLLERGSKLVGETRGQVQQGSARVFVLWTEARTPTGVIVPLDSPGTDELGRSGLAGQVERHFWDRFGAAILISVIDSAAQTVARPSGGTLIYSPTASQDVVTEVLKGTIDIPPTVTKSQGDRIQVLVARDLDFRSVYELRAVDERR
jgi:type IV secretion system protein VirB10